MEAGGITEEGTGGGKKRDDGRAERGETDGTGTDRKSKSEGMVRRSDRREDSITRHRQPYLIAIGFSLPKACAGFIKIVFIRRPS